MVQFLLPAVTAAGSFLATNAPAAAAAGKSGFSYAMEHPTQFLGAGLFGFGIYKAVPWGDLIPGVSLLSTTQYTSMELRMADAFLGAACIAGGLYFLTSAGKK